MVRRSSFSLPFSLGCITVHSKYMHTTHSFWRDWLSHASRWQERGSGFAAHPAGERPGGSCVVDVSDGLHLPARRKMFCAKLRVLVQAHQLSRPWLECSLRLCACLDKRFKAAVPLSIWVNRCLEHDRLLWRSRRWLWLAGRATLAVAVVPSLLPHATAASCTDCCSARTSTCWLGVFEFVFP